VTCVPTERPVVRVLDAALVDEGGPARLIITGLPRAQEVADKVASARGVYRFDGERLYLVAVPDRLVDAAGRAGRAPLASLLRSVLDPALAAWRDGPPDLPTPGGDLPTSRCTVVMGVLNVTPDSFSDGGRHLDPQAAIDAGTRMLAAGADVIDVGGESTRPGAEPVPADEELERVVPVVRGLAATGAIVSIDTMKAAVAQAAVDAGAALVNDVSAGAFDPQLLPTVAELEVPYVLTHLRGEPRTMQQDPTYDDVVAEVFDHLAERLEALAAIGIPAERVAIDPGIGFGKTMAHNLQLLHRLREFTSLGRPVLVGASRKSFLGRLTGVEDPEARLAGSLGAAVAAVGAGARIVRVHDVAATVEAVGVADAIARGRAPEHDETSASDGSSGADASPDSDGAA
jgi:dihydropteroate synthase